MAAASEREFGPKVSVVDKPLSNGKSEVSSSAFAYLFLSIVQYSQARIQNTKDLEKRLEDLGFHVGLRQLELLCHRDKVSSNLPYT